MSVTDREVEIAAVRIREIPNGAALAAFLAAGIGSFVMGLVVLLNEMGVVAIPAIYAPAGGVSGRTTLAIVIWLVVWAVLHARWKEREVAAAGVAAATILLILLGIIGTFPPLWALLP